MISLILTLAAFALAIEILMGFLTQRVIRNKGYTTNWFWWGFFFGAIALIVALSRPKVYRPASSKGKWWQCSCGRMNPYMVRCNCGKTQGEVAAEKK